MSAGCNVQCYSCERALGGSEGSREHIIPNAIGGQTASKNLLCEECNTSFGRLYEADFAKQMRFFSGRLAIRRDRGKNQKFKGVDRKSGLAYFVNEEGEAKLAHPVAIELPSETGRYKFLVPDLKAAERLMANIQRKHPNQKVEFKMEEETERSEPVPEVHFEFGDLAFFKTATKSMLNLFIANGGSRLHVTEVINNVFRSKCDPPAWILPSDPERAPDMAMPHTVAVIGCEIRKLLIGYLELFGGIRVIAILNENYSGSSCSFGLRENPLQGSATNAEVSINMGRSEILQVVGQRQKDDSNMTKTLMLMERDVRTNQHYTKIIKDTLKETFLNPAKKALSVEQMSSEIATVLSNKLLPDIVRASEKRRAEAEQRFRDEIQSKKGKE